MNIEQLLKTKGMEVIAVSRDGTVGEAARILAEKNKGLALVCDGENRLLGVVSVIDISRAVGKYGERVATTPVEAIMTTDYTCARPEDSAEDALQMMAKRGVRHLPVVAAGKLKGLLNMRGVLEYRLEVEEMKAGEMLRYISGVGYR
ncbi:MAG: CBS domain-containing protein [Alphaproteobacteria bacterium]|nr:CBS domain-containing protein [Alphaproteobacteria bacterium]